MYPNDLIYKIGLTLINGIGDVLAKNLVRHCGSAEAVFKENKRLLEKIQGFGKIKTALLNEKSWMQRAEEELKFIEKNRLNVFFFTDDDYPSRLHNCHDSPVLLYFDGNTNLNSEKLIGIVGTRSPSDYGIRFTKEFIGDLQQENIVVVSGLAFGIDGLVHEACLNSGVKTIGVIGHGLDRIYPYQNAHLAQRMKNQGGLLTEFTSRTNPDRENFPKRNRIVAGICDAIIVIESKVEGGSMITADIANSYNRDVFAVPGKSKDEKSGGCNFLIKKNKAALIENFADVVHNMNWVPIKSRRKNNQCQLPINLSLDEKCIIEALKKNNKTHINQLVSLCNMPVSKISATLLGLELDNHVICHPGKFFSLPE